MASVEAQYFDGSSVEVKTCKNIGSVMVHIANLHQQFASEVTVTCPESGKELSDHPSESSPPLVQVVVRVNPGKTQSWTDEELLLTLYLHAQHEDLATCKRAFDILKTNNPLCTFWLKEILDKANGDIDVEAKVLRTLLRIDVGFKKNYLLKQACENGDEKRVKMLLAEGVPVEYEKHPEDEAGDANKGSALSVAAFEGHTHLVKMLLANKADVNSTIGGVNGKFFGTPLSFASAKGHIDVVNMLLSCGAVVNLAAHASWPLGEACLNGQAKVADILLANHADINYHNWVHSIKLTPLSTACLSENFELTTMLVSSRASVNLVDSLDYVPLVYAQTADLTKILLDHGAFVNFVSGDGETLLSMASQDKRLGKVQLLLDHGAHINRANYVGETALIQATKRGSIKTASLLLERKANVNYCTNEGKTALEYAFDHDHTALVNVLQHHGALCSRNCASGANENAVLAASFFSDDVRSLVKNIEAKGHEVVHATREAGGESCPEAQRKLQLATKRFIDEVILLSRVGSQFSRFSDEFFTDTKKRELESCAPASAEKRQKSSGDEKCLPKNISAEEKEKNTGDSSFSNE